MNTSELLKSQIGRIKKNRQDLEQMLEMELAEQARIKANLDRIDEKVAKIRGGIDYSDLVMAGLESDARAISPPN